MPPPKTGQGGATPSLYGVRSGRRFGGALHDLHAPAGQWRSSSAGPWRCEACHPPAVPRLVAERRPAPQLELEPGGRAA